MKKNQKFYNAHKSKLITHLVRNVIYGIFFTTIALFIGMLGYHFLEKMPWIDAFASASMILSGMGPLAPLTSFAGKLFAGFYALFSGLVFIAIVVLVFSPIIRQFFHKIHLEAAADSQE